MDAPVIRWLLGIEVDPSASGAIRLGWENPLPGWMWLLGLAAACALGWLAYTGMTRRRIARRILETLRVAILMLVLILVARPTLEFVEEARDPDRILVLADRSLSLQLGDWKDTSGTLRTREEQLHAAAAAMQTGDRRVEWFGFDDDLQPVNKGELGAPDGKSTDIPLAIERALRRTTGAPIGGIVLLTDGRSTRPIDARVEKALQARSIPVFAVALGSTEPIGDAAILEVQAPARAFIKDQVPVVVRVRPLREGIGELELVDTESGAVLDRTRVAPGEPTTEVLVATTETGEPLKLSVRLRVVGDDAVPANNERSVTISVLDRPVRLLMVEAYPRWEYRFVKNLLVREPSMESSIMLLSADRDFTQEGNMAVARLPMSREEFDLYDVFMIGDVAAGQFSDQQLDELRRAVTERGAGLLLIGGERSMPTQWIGSGLDDLFPMRLSSTMERVPEAVTMVPTTTAQSLGLLRLGDGEQEWPTELSLEGPTWSRLQWMQRIPFADLKPTAEPLAEAMGATTEPVGAAVVAMRYGAGQVLYTATDETWRWRNGIGEAYQERFWIQLVRFLSRASLSVGGTGTQLSVDPEVVTVGQPATVRLDVKDSLVQRKLPESLDAEAQQASTSRGRIRLTTDAATKGSLVVGLTGVWRPTTPGDYTITVADQAFGTPLTTTVHVIEPDDEFARPETDHHMLHALCTATGGRVLTDDDLTSLDRVIPDRSVFTERVERTRLWASPLALMVLVLLCSLEWAGRRWLRLA